MPDGSPTLAAMPGFTLASVDQLSLGSFLPDLVASFFASIGLRHTSYLRMEAEGVEVTELPLTDFLAALEAACMEPGFRLRSERYARTVAFAYNTLVATAVPRLRCWVHGTPAARPC